MKTNITLDSVFADFSKYLSPDSNSRIIFSAPFGMGKTFFLKEYFSNYAKEQFIPVHIYPVNYSVAHNADIFELIKYDILCELLPLIEMEELKVGKIEALQYVDAKDVYGIFKAFLKAVPVIGKETVEILEPLENLLKVINKTIKEKQKGLGKDDKQAIREFAKNFADSGIYESDIYTHLIIDFIEQLKGGKKVALIVDDLDRIDPEHLFRILNVFAAHFDQRGGDKNKFGFDKILVVCDIKNVRSIFRHRYGDDVDFSGYINKFYSSHVYELNNRDALSQFVVEVVGSFVVRVSTAPTNRDTDIFLTEILRDMLLSGTVSLRVLYAFYGKTFEKFDLVYHIRSHPLKFTNFPFVRVIYILHQIFEGHENLMERLSRTSFRQIETIVRNKLAFFDPLLILADSKGHVFNGRDISVKSYTGESYKYDYSYFGVSFETHNSKYAAHVIEIREQSNALLLYGGKSNSESVNLQNPKVDIKELILEAFKQIDDSNR